MVVNDLLKQNSITKYQLAKSSGVPYTTVSDICNGKAQMEKCSAETIYKLAKALKVSMETLLEPCLQNRIDFELYKSNVCHRLKRLGDIAFIAEILEKDEIQDYYQRQWYPESLYLLGMLDYISRLNGIPLCNRYDALRRCTLSDVIYPAGILTMAIVSQNEELKHQAFQEAIPEFKRFNIVENEVRNVV